MIVVSANWLISDGSLFPPPNAASIRRFLGRLGPLACRAGMRPDGSYRPVERLDLVLAGDTFDAITSRSWLGRIRPWHGGRAVRGLVDQLAARSVRAGRAVLRAVHAVVRNGIEVPSADDRWRPRFASPTCVPVNLTLIHGDRDEAFEFSTPWRDVVRPGIAIASAWQRLGAAGESVVVRHGHEFDPLCFAGEEPRETVKVEDAMRTGRPPTLAESLGVDLVAAFAWGLAGSGVPAAVREPLVRLLAQGPMLDMPNVVGEFVAGCVDPALGGRVETGWKRAIDRWHEGVRVDPPVSPAAFDVIDATAAWMEGLRKDFSADGLGRWLEMCRRDLPRPDHASPRLVLGHPPCDLCGAGPPPSAGAVAARFGDGTIAIGSPRSGEEHGLAEPSPFDGATVVEVAGGRRPRPDEPAWVVIPDGSGLIASPGLAREAA